MVTSLTPHLMENHKCRNIKSNLKIFDLCRCVCNHKYKILLDDNDIN